MTTRASSLAGALPVIAVLGLITGCNALAIDMYLPATSNIAQSLGSDESVIQASLGIYLAGGALGQLLVGPLTDRFGRRRPLMIGMTVFTLASLVVALSQDLTVFMLGRMVQGFAGAAGMVIPRILVSEMFDRQTSAKAFTVLMQIMMIAPLTAPSLGGGLLLLSDWHAVFWALTAFGVILLFASWRVAPETLPPEARQSRSVGQILGIFGSLLSARQFAGLALSGSCTAASLFIYISASSFIFSTHYGLSPQIFALVFAGNAAGMILFGRINLLLLRQRTSIQTHAIGLTVHICATVVMAAGLALGADSLAFVLPLMFLSIGSFGMILANVTASAMWFAGPNRGSASSLLGVMQFSTGGLAGVVVSALQGSSILVPIFGMVICAAVAAVARIIAFLPRQSEADTASDRCGALPDLAEAESRP